MPSPVATPAGLANEDPAKILTGAILHAHHARAVEEGLPQSPSPHLSKRPARRQKPDYDPRWGCLDANRSRILPQFVNERGYLSP